MIKIIVSLSILLLLWVLYPLFIPVDVWHTSIKDDSNVSNVYEQSIKNRSFSPKKDMNTLEKPKKVLKVAHNKPKKITRAPIKRPQRSPKFRCDRRIYCSQMHSYEEAKYFLDHCGPVRMDGDGDGIPCERQFGRH